MMLTRILPLSELISMPYPAALFSSLAVSCWNSSSVPSKQIDVVSKSHVAKLSSTVGHWRQCGVSLFCIYYCKPIKTVFLPYDGCWGVKALCIAFSGNMLNINGDSGHPCSPTLPFLFSSTALVASSYNDLMTSISRLSMLYSFKARQRPSCQTRSNALLKSTKLWKISFWCSMCFSTNSLKLNICSAILFCDQKNLLVPIHKSDLPDLSTQIWWQLPL